MKKYDQVEPGGTDSSKVPVAKATVTIGDTQMPLVGQLIASIVLLIALVIGLNEWDKDEWFKQKNWGYGIAAAVIAMCFSILGIFLSFNSKWNDMPVEFTSSIMKNTASVGSLNNIFLFVWWIIAAGILTFDGPFVLTSNGYFACWAGCILSTIGLGYSINTLQESVTSLGSLLGLGVASVVVILALLGSFSAFLTESIFSMVVACLSLLAVSSIWYAERIEFKINYYVEVPMFSVLSFLWILLACLVTFSGPFQSTGNGYFASWGGAIMSAVLAVSSLKRKEDDSEDPSYVEEGNIESPGDDEPNFSID
eukprot:scaffold68343_cov40-Attheya_sp.AAC.1